MGVTLIVPVSRDYKNETAENTRVKNAAEQIIFISLIFWKKYRDIP
jgi:hypothetical protein